MCGRRGRKAMPKLDVDNIQEHILEPQTQQVLPDLVLDEPMANLSLCSRTTTASGIEDFKCPGRIFGKDFKDSMERCYTAFPDFWRKTQSNKILEHKNKLNKKKASYGLIKPSKLQFILEPQHNSLTEETARIPASTAPLPDVTCLRIQSQTYLTTTASNKNSEIDLSQLCIVRMKKTSRWKPRVKCRLLVPSLPTIPEDCTEGNATVNSFEDLNISAHGQLNPGAVQSCSQQALTETNNNGPSDDITIDELASYLDLLVHIPKKMSAMAEMMYT